MLSRVVLSVVSVVAIGTMLLIPSFVYAQSTDDRKSKITLGQAKQVLEKGDDIRQELSDCDGVSPETCAKMQPMFSNVALAFIILGVGITVAIVLRGWEIVSAFLGFFVR